MKIKARLIVSAAIGSLSLLASAQPACAQGTVFTYQGRLNDGGHPANGNYDLTFGVLNAACGPSQTGGGVTSTNSQTPSVALSASPWPSPSTGFVVQQANDLNIAKED